MRFFIRFVPLACLICLFAACHRPTAYFQRTPHVPAVRLSIDQPNTVVVNQPAGEAEQPNSIPATVNEPVVASLKSQPIAVAAEARVERRMHRIQSMLTVPVATETADKQPRPKPKQKLKLGNQIRGKLGVPLRKELNWWQKISWKLKASVIVILVAVVFAIAGVNILAIIFGLLGAFLLITGLKKSMKVRRPWF